MDIHTRVTRGLLPAITRVHASRGPVEGHDHAVAEALVAVRRWQLRHGGNLPRRLDSRREGRRPCSGPLDPYDGRPIRFAVVDGQPTVYAIGQDGRDDGGRIDNSRSPDSGDVLLRLPKP